MSFGQMLNSIFGTQWPITVTVHVLPCNSNKFAGSGVLLICFSFPPLANNSIRGSERSDPERCSDVAADSRGCSAGYSSADAEHTSRATTANAADRGA